MDNSRRIVRLTEIISHGTKIVDDFLVSRSFPTPTLDHTAEAALPISEDAPHVEDARKMVIEATAELQALMKGPRELLRIRWTQHVGLHAIYKYGMAEAFPVGEEASFGTIGKKVGLSEKLTRRLLRHAMHEHLFTEPREGFVAHTGLTKLLAQDNMMLHNVGAALEEFWPPSTKVVDAIQKYGESEEPTEAAFTLANNTGGKSTWQFYAENPQRSELFGRAMSAMDKVKGYEPSLLIYSFPWAELGKGTVVDLGGSHGTVMTNIARAFPELTCYSQDLPEVIEEAKKMLPDDVKDRVKLQAHDFFTEQPISADVYYTRSILHNWSDKYGIKLLRALTPALRKGSCFLVHELIVPPPNTLPKVADQRIRDMDIGMLQLLNATQRDEKEWKALFKEADQRWELAAIRRPPGGAQSIAEFRWMGEEGRAE